ncbi:MAG: sodium/proline symporter [Cyclobacteriaceae bacterium]|nr:sodium/proline symporter [Cyclobacteriaceae bacterium]
MSFTLFGFIFYLVALLVIGFFTYRSNKDHQDYYLGGRRVNHWIVAFSERASGESAWLILGLPGAAYAAGIVEIWTALGCVSGIIFYWYAIAKDLRIQSEMLNAITLPDFFAQKFKDGETAIRVTATLIIIFFFTFYLSAQFNGAGKVLYVTFDIDPFWGMVIGATFIILYTMLGGFFAVALTDLIQGIIMIGALVILPLAGITEILTSKGEYSLVLSQQGSHFTSLGGEYTGWMAVAIALSGLSWGFGYMGQPHLLIRFMSIKNADQIRLSRRIAFIWAIPAFTGGLLIGLVGLSMYGQGYFEDVEQVMPHLANSLLPPWLAGIFISGAIAAMMSTADSQLLVISSSVMEDIYHKTLKREVAETFLLKISRGITILVGIGGFIIALYSEKLIFSMVSYAWAGLSAAFGPALLLTLKWKKTTWQGVLAGMILGTLFTIIWTEIEWLENVISSRLSGFLIALSTVYVVSLITGKSNRQE